MGCGAKTSACDVWTRPHTPATPDRSAGRLALCEPCGGRPPEAVPRARRGSAGRATRGSSELFGRNNALTPAGSRSRSPSMRCGGTEEPRALWWREALRSPRSSQPVGRSSDMPLEKK